MDNQSSVDIVFSVLLNPVTAGVAILAFAGLLVDVVVTNIRLTRDLRNFSD